MTVWLTTTPCLCPQRTYLRAKAISAKAGPNKIVSSLCLPYVFVRCSCTPEPPISVHVEGSWHHVKKVYRVLTIGSVTEGSRLTIAISKLSLVSKIHVTLLQKKIITNCWKLEVPFHKQNTLSVMLPWNHDLVRYYYTHLCDTVHIFILCDQY